MIRRFYESLSGLLKEHPTLAVATVIEKKGSAPRDIDAKMAVLPDGSTFGTIGGGGLEKLVIDDALDAMEEGGSFTKTYDLSGRESGGTGQICGGTASVHVEIIRSPDTILLCGGGHIAKAIAPMAVLLGLNLIVVDEREQYASKDRFPGAWKILKASPLDPKVRELVTSSTYIVILTYSHKGDKEALKNLVSTKAAYIGMIGSRKKVEKILDELESEGVPADALGRVYSPIGLDIGAETPAEIAISILSEIIHVKRKDSSSAISMRMTPRTGVGDG
jgi:xanthine dehydrogenase accessory factor